MKKKMNKGQLLTSNVGKTELGFFCTALQHNENYLPTNFREQQTYVRADKGATICSPFGEHKNVSAIIYLLSGVLHD
jgi:hypothetical protein